MLAIVAAAVIGVLVGGGAMYLSGYNVSSGRKDEGEE